MYLRQKSDDHKKLMVKYYVKKYNLLKKHEEHISQKELEK